MLLLDGVWIVQILIIFVQLNGLWKPSTAWNACRGRMERCYLVFKHASQFKMAFVFILGYFIFRNCRHTEVSIAWSLKEGAVIVGSVGLDFQQAGRSSTGVGGCQAAGLCCGCAELGQAAAEQGSTGCRYTAVRGCLLPHGSGCLWTGVSSCRSTARCFGFCSPSGLMDCKSFCRTNLITPIITVSAPAKLSLYKEINKEVLAAWGWKTKRKNKITVN